ncbi:hypothetical protein LTR84_010019 [Exophiala bonariae]|uniref:GPI anchored cell wall protein n=1 Tax=Exophiala bonariae TaxID=1690606 RepID=A0AAV9NNN2_9EURO|nr:hypothetical protein LTR84_010019 [Exophiala bonariae]
MSLIQKSAVAVALIGAVHAQQSVINIFFPDVAGDLVGSVISSDSAATTLVVACPATVSAVDCELPTPITVTAGPSTFVAGLEQVVTETDTITAQINCVVEGTTAATCAQTFVGPANWLVDQESASTTNTEITTTVTTDVLTGTDVTFQAITLVDSIDSGAAATTGPSGSGSTAASTRSGTGSSTGSATGTSSGSSTVSQTGSSTSSGAGAASQTGNSASRTDSRALAFSALGAGLLALTAFVL